MVGRNYAESQHIKLSFVIWVNRSFNKRTFLKQNYIAFLALKKKKKKTPPKIINKKSTRALQSYRKCGPSSPPLIFECEQCAQKWVSVFKCV